MKKNIVLLLTLYIVFKIFIKYKIIIESIQTISLVFIKNVFPPLFIFFIISTILINYGFIDLINILFGKSLKKMFNLNKYTAYIFFMSILTGLPSSAKYTKEMLDKKLITKKEAESILMYTHFVNPLFILTIAKYKPYLVLFACFIPNIIIGLIFKNKDKNYENKNIDKNKTKPFTILITDAILSSFNTLLTVFGLIIIFYTLASITDFKILKYLLEMTSSITYLNSLIIPAKLYTMLVTGIMAFGGICVHMQVTSILAKEKIRYAPYLLARIIHFIISTFIIYILY